MTHSDRGLQAALADMERLSNVLGELDDALITAESEAERLDGEPIETQQQADDISARMNAVDEEITRLRQQFEDASGDLDRATEAYERLRSGRDYDDEHDEGEALSDTDAADIWLSNGMDEDYMFGYSEEELRRAAGM